MARLWEVAREGVPGPPLLMKVPLLVEGGDPAAIVSFDMEQMILPRLSGSHVPRFVASGYFSIQPYLVMERIPGPPFCRVWRICPSRWRRWPPWGRGSPTPWTTCTAST
jgi:hypothetical protein